MEQQQFEQLAERSQRQAEIVKELLDADPSLGFITALVKSSDMAHAEYVDKAFQAGELTLERALILIGSYARFDWIVRQFQNGKIEPEAFYKLLPGEWVASDPDDTDLRFLAIWKKAHILNGKIIMDKKIKLPDESVLTIYHGQDRTAKSIGISWTMDKDVAVSFANGVWARQPRDGIVLKGNILKRKIMAYLTGRDEEEVIVNPVDILNIERLETTEV